MHIGVWVLRRGWAFRKGFGQLKGAEDPPFLQVQEPVSPPRSITLKWKCKTISLGGGGGVTQRVMGGQVYLGLGNWSLGCSPSLGICKSQWRGP